MADLYLIPDRKNMEQSMELAVQYDCHFEYNDFFLPQVLESKKEQQEIIRIYRRVRQDFSRDTIHGAFFDVTIHSDDPEIKAISEKRVRQSMEIAQELGVKGVIFHTGRIYGFREPGYIDKWLTRNEVFFRKMLLEFPGQEIYMENMFDEAPDILAQLAERMKDQKRFGVCLDYAHAAVFGVDLSQWIAQLAPYMKHVHINDNYLGEDDHLTMGVGNIDWDKFTAQMKQCQVDASVLVEVRTQKAQEASLHYMKQNSIYPL